MTDRDTIDLNKAWNKFIKRQGEKMDNRNLIEAIRKTIPGQPRQVLAVMLDVYGQKAEQDTPDQEAWQELVEDIRQAITAKGGRVP